MKFVSRGFVHFWIYIVVGASALAQDARAAEPATKSSAATYRDDVFGFAFDPPDYWLKLAYKTSVNILVEFVTNEDEPGRIKSNLDVFFFPVPAGTTNDDIPNRLKADPNQISRNEEWTEPVATTLGGEPAVEMIETGVSNKTGRAHKREWVGLIHNGKEFLVSFDVDPGGFDQVSPIANKSVESFQWITPKIAQQATDHNAEPMVAYEDPQHRFQISRPKRWVSESTSGNTAVKFGEPFEGPEDNFAENIGVGVTQLPQHLDLEALVPSLVPTFGAKFKEFKLLSSKKTTLSQTPAHSIDFTMINKDGTTVRETQIYSIVGSTMYIVTFASTPEAIDAHRPIWDAMVSSFQIEKP